MKNNLTMIQWGIFVAGFITFGGCEFNLVSLSIIAVISLWPKQPEPTPCKVYDFAEYKARRDAAKMPTAFKKAA